MASRPDDLRGYQRQTAPRATAPLPATRPEAFGAGVAAEVGRTAQIISRERLEDRAIDRRLTDNRQWAEFQTEFATLREEMAAASREARQDYQGDHAERLGQTYEERKAALLEKVTSPRVGQRAQAALDTWGAAYRSGEADWETVRVSEIAVEGARETINVAANRSRRLDRPEDYAAELTIVFDMIDGIEASDKVKEGLVREAEQTLAVSYLQGRIDDDPELAKGMLQSGAFDEVLEPAQVEALLNGSDVAIRRAGNAERQKLTAAEALLREDYAVVRAEIKGGVERGEQLVALRQRAEALGLRSEVAEITNLIAENVFAKGFEGATPVQLEQRAAVLRGKERSEAEDRELNWIDDHIDGVTTRFNRDPVEFLAEGGNPPPPIDFADPDSIAARSRWARGAGVPMLSKREGDALAQVYEQGREGEEQVLGLLNTLPPAQAMQAATMIDAGDRTLPIMATLPMTSRNMARRGREKLADDRQFLSERIKASLDVEENIAEVRQMFERALINVDPDQRRAIRETGEQILAGYIDKTGGGLDRRAYLMGLNMALGATGTGEDQRGGLATFAGERMVLLPDGYTKREFVAEYVRKARTNALKPVNPDGSAANLARTYPVPVAPGVYEFHDRAGNPVMRSDMQAPWRVRVGE